ncbi:hypothetical protein ACVINW_004140 [Bradyrhizobium sp. USDA 4461]
MPPNEAYRGTAPAVPHAFHRNSHTATGFVPGFRLSNAREFIAQDIVWRSLTLEHVSAVFSFAC